MPIRERVHPQWVNGRPGLDDPGRTSPDDDEAQEADQVHAGTPYQPADANQDEGRVKEEDDAPTM